tara:strand:+ start:88 stop:261 length:174 start_codon:yes stop_codon:yes gene_type:complete
MTLNITTLKGSYTYDIRDNGAVITFFPGKGSKLWPQSTLVSVDSARQHFTLRQAEVD